MDLDRLDKDRSPDALGRRAANIEMPWRSHKREAIPNFVALAGVAICQQLVGALIFHQLLAVVAPPASGTTHTLSRASTCAAASRVVKGYKATELQQAS
jgi:hypothetical protein